MKKILQIVLALAVLGAGCNDKPQVAHIVVRGSGQSKPAYVGSHFGELVKKWGPPTLVMPDGKGGQILGWTEVVELDRKPPMTYNWGQTRGRVNVPLSSHMHTSPTYQSGSSGWSITRPGKVTYLQTVRTAFVDPNGIVSDWNIKQVSP